MTFARYISLFLVVAITLASSFSCSKKVDHMDDVLASLDTSKKYLALGDSYTIGQSVAPEERFPNQVVHYLQDAQIKVQAPDIIATTGWTTRDLLNSLDNNTPRNNYSIVTLLIGVNNQYQHRSLTEYKSEFTILLNRAIQYAGNIKSHVFVLSIPDYSVTPFASGSDTARIAREINDFNQVNQDVSQLIGIKWIDITGISREAKTNPALIANDGLHPSGLQYKRWADLLAPIVKEAIR